jgi:putative hemolysin
MRGEGDVSRRARWMGQPRGRYLSNYLRCVRAVVVLLCVAGILILPSAAMKDPSSVYCASLGYEFTVVMTDAGEQGFCTLPNDQKVNAWHFLQGKAGQEYSYCELEGYEMKTIRDPERCVRFLTDECAVCVRPDGSEVEVTELMGLDFRETVCGDGVCGIPENYLTCPQDCPADGYDGYCNPDFKETDEDCIAEMGDTEERETPTPTETTPLSTEIVILASLCAAFAAALRR